MSYSQLRFKSHLGLHVCESHYRVHECGFGVCHQHKDISIQAKLVNPAVQLCRDISPRAVRWKTDQCTKFGLCRVFRICWDFPDVKNGSCYLSTRTRSSRSRAHLVFGQNTRTRQPASRLSSMWRAWASWFTVCTGVVNIMHFFFFLMPKHFAGLYLNFVEVMDF